MSDGAPDEPDDVVPILDDAAGEGGGPGAASAPAAAAWRVLVVDDDDDVHETTAFALAGATILGRPLELLHARSAAEAWHCVRSVPDIAVALVDVVMETPDAGLRLVRELRAAGHDALRIVLRTGQPGYAPELSVIASYEIDDYRTKAELTRTRLLTVLTASIRAYDQIRTIARSRAGLEMIVESSTRLFQRTNLELFARGVLTQIAALLRVRPNGIVGVGSGDDGGAARVVSALGRFADCAGTTVDALTDADLRDLLQAVRGTDEPVTRDGFTALHVRSESGRELSALVEAGRAVDPQDLTLLKLFATNIGIGFENLTLVERLDRLAHVDPVLDVPNVNALEAALLARAQDGWADGRIALVRVDSYRSVVAAYGMGVAHGLLRAVHDALAVTAAGPLTIARLGDRVFALLGDRGVVDDALVPAAVARPFVVDGIEVATTATGVLVDLAGLPTEPKAVVQAATLALLHVAHSRRGICVRYDAAMRGAIVRQGDLQRALKAATAHWRGFAVHLQPKFGLADGALVGAEALLRWTREGEAVAPSEFIPIAESAGLTQALTDFVIDTIGGWAAGRGALAAVPVAVNLSMTDLNTPGFADRLLARIAAAGLAPDALEFEVTESVAMQDAPWPLEQVRALRQAGARIALDDFGTGFSSLGQFDSLPVDTLKIDRRFVAPLTPADAGGSLAAIIIAMARALGVSCVAEGIETEDQRRALAALGCPVGQGFLMGRPVPIEAFDRLFAALPPPG